jgi:predicted transcriptional regulator
MSTVDPLTVLNTLIRHETMTIQDLSKEENLGLSSNSDELKAVLDHLSASGFVNALHDVSPATYTITDKGISEGARRNRSVKLEQ